jgi:16S rRNA (guanine1207-N2)-methyltransferase
MRGVMEHYFTKEPKGEYNEQTMTAVIAGRNFGFHTADGVFSKGALDYGTAILLEAFYKAHSSAGTLLDLGCGYGPVGISAAVILGAQVTMRDINSRAVALSQKNARENGVTADIAQGDGYEGIQSKYDIIITNPPIRAGKKTYYPWVEQAPEYLNAGGEFWAVVQKKQGADSFKKLMEQTFGNCETMEREAGYHVMRAIYERDI